MHYKAEVDRGEPGQIAYGAVVPDLPGCFAAGETLEELLANLMAAATLWIECAHDDGDHSHAKPTGFVLDIEVPV